MDTKLAALLQRAGAALAEHGGEPPWPDPVPVDGEEVAGWADRVRRTRDLHDALALEADRRFGWGPVGAPVLASIRDEEVAVDGRRLPVRLYRPKAAGPLPVLLLLHGGSFWMAGGAARLALTDTLCRRLSDRTPAVVVSLDYRLAPEHRYPAPVEDVHATLAWLAGQATRWSLDPDRIGLLGISSGAHVAAGAALTARDRPGPRPRALLLMTPFVQSPRAPFDLSSPDHSLDQAVARVADLYLPAGLDPATEHPALSPLDAADLTGLPPTHLAVAEVDPLTPAAVRFAERLAAAGVPCTLSSHPMTHTLAPPTVLGALADVLADRARQLLA